jgi:hypothetical protein
MPCYLTYMAETTTPIAPEVYKHALRFVDESIVEQLTQSESTLKKAESLSLVSLLITRNLLMYISMFSQRNTN